MSETRPSLTPSLSFSALPSSSTLSRPLKRRLTTNSDLPFFTPAATSFKPRPYTPDGHGALSESSEQRHSTRNHLRSIDQLAIPAAGMDPLPTEPNVVFIHPPFTDFPKAHLYPDGLSYQLMSENPEWFLCAMDFISAQSTNPHAISYPPHLEPPRGWCPAKKKDLKDRGSEGWPEGEEPRLRCTFCRRTYAGVNAKSMWRRHVFEKHKIAMSNRRDGLNNDRPRGRGSNSMYILYLVEFGADASVEENRQSRPRDEAHDNSMDVDPQTNTDARSTSYRSRSRPLLPTQDISRRSERSNRKDTPTPTAPVIPQEELPSSQPFLTIADPRPHPLSQSTLPPMTPPLTPDSSFFSENEEGVSQASAALPASPISSRSVIPPSPYNPLLTPSFRHSPPRLPSDQPWRFPSPSHPLHSKRELCLTTLSRSQNSPAATALNASPLVVRGTPLRSPSIMGRTRSKTTSELETPESIARLPRPSPRALFSRERLLFSSADRKRSERLHHQVEDSPLSRVARKNARGRKALEATDDWPLVGSLASVASSPNGDTLLTGSDPFIDMYSPWGHNNNGDNEDAHDRCSQPLSSPVLRSHSLPTGFATDGTVLVGLGIGLLDPFTLSRDAVPSIDDFDRMQPSDEEEGDEAEVAGSLTDHSPTKKDLAQPPPAKKRRMTIDN